MIEYSQERKVAIERLIVMFNEVGWNDKSGDVARLEAMVRNSQIVVTAWDGDIMVGFARCVTDHVYNGQINNVVVDSKYRRQGIGKELLTRVVSCSNQVTYVLRGDLENEGFYKRLGFKQTELCFVFPRSE